MISSGMELMSTVRHKQEDQSLPEEIDEMTHPKNKLDMRSGEICLSREISRVEVAPPISIPHRVLLRRTGLSARVA
jgi:hypothetical protein